MQALPVGIQADNATDSEQRVSVMYSNKAKVTQCAAEQRKRLLKQQPHEVQILPSLLRGQSTSPPQLDDGSV